MAFATPIFLASSSFGAYFLFGGLSLFTLVVLAVLMPETRGRGLEEIQDGFRRPAVNPALLGRKLLSGVRFRGNVNRQEHEMSNPSTRDISSVNTEESYSIAAPHRVATNNS